MKLLSPIPFVILLGLGLSLAAGDDPPPKDEKKSAPMPWHMVDSWWDIGQDAPIESLCRVAGGSEYDCVMWAYRSKK